MFIQFTTGPGRKSFDGKLKIVNLMAGCENVGRSFGNRSIWTRWMFNDELWCLHSNRNREASVHNSVYESSKFYAPQTHLKLKLLWSALWANVNAIQTSICKRDLSFQTFDYKISYSDGISSNGAGLIN